MQESYTKVIKGVSKETIWNIWSDIKNWPKWDPDLESIEVFGPFDVGTEFVFKPKGAPKVKLKLVEVQKNIKYTDCACFFGAKLYGIHEMQEEPNGDLKLTTTVKVTGVLSFLWWKLVAKDIVATLPEQTDNLVKLVKANG